MRLKGGNSFLVISYDSSTKLHRIFLEPNLPNVISKWTPTTRISPVFFIENHEPPPEHSSLNSGSLYLNFIGPVQPFSLMSIVENGDILLMSLGLFNFIIITAREDRNSQLISWLKQHDIRYESWDIKDGIVNGITPSSPLDVSYDKYKDTLVKIASSSTPLALKDSVFEFCPLLSTTITRSSHVLPNVANDFSNISLFVKEWLEDIDEDNIAQINGTHRDLINTNAALSRFASQTFSGFTPITNTECHYWTHSLLGTGTANIALYRIYKFIIDRLGEYNIPSRLFNLVVSKEYNHKDLFKLPYSDPFWHTDHLKKSPPGDDGLNNIPFPPLSYFSGRDSFKSTRVTLSAPLAAISSCNSDKWSLMTLTHEISHQVIEGCLAVLYPDLLSEKEVKHASSLLLRSESYIFHSWIEAVTKLFLAGIDSLNTYYYNDNLRFSDPIELRHILRRWYHDVAELMAHIFDFLCFYDSDETLYIPGIWKTWSTIPNVSHRAEEYVMRSLTAVMTKYLDQGNEAEKNAYRDLKKYLAKLNSGEKNNQLFTKALGILKAKGPEPNGDGSIIQELTIRRPIMAVVNAFIYSEEGAGLLFSEDRIKSGRKNKDGYSKRVNIFDGEKIDNPIRFVRAFSKEKSPSSVRSAWILSNIAYNT